MRISGDGRPVSTLKLDVRCRRADDGRLPSPSAVQRLHSTAANWNCRPSADVKACSKRAFRNPLTTSLTSVEVAQRKRPPERLSGQARLFFLAGRSMATNCRLMICATMSYLLADPL